MYQKNSNGAISILLGVLLGGALAGEYLDAVIKMMQAAKRLRQELGWE